MEKLKVVQIGIGHDHGTSGFNSILSQDEYFDVLGFAIPQEELDSGKWESRIAEYRDDRKVPYYSVENALNLSGLEAVIVESEEMYLTKYALMALQKGLHVYMDKPGSPDLTEFEKLVNTARENNLTFNVGYMYRFNPMIIEAKRRIDNGEIGEVYSVEAHMNCEHVPGKRKWLEQFPGGMMYFLGCHLVDLVNIFQGEPDEIVPFNCSTGIDNVTADDYGMAVFKYKNGISFVKSCAAECGGFMRRQFVICGSKGTIEFKPLEAFDKEAPRDFLYTEVRFTGKSKGWQHFEPTIRSEYYNRFDAMMQSFADSVKGRVENPFSLDHELRTFKMLLKSCGVQIK